MKDKLRQAGAASALLIVLSGLAIIAAHPGLVRDYLTPKEVERVKEARILDKRIEVFIKVAERRILALTDPAASGKQAQKDLDKWGELPKGTRVELLMDISNILDEAVTNIDDVAVRDEKNSLLPKALRKLADAATRFQAQLLAMREQIGEGQERSALERVMENVQEILGAAGKLPPPEKK